MGRKGKSKKPEREGIVIDLTLFSMLHLLEMYLLKKLMQMGNLLG